MNVQESLLQERIDPHLSDRVLTEFARRAADAGTRGDAPVGEPAARGPAADVRGYHVLTGGCWNRVIAVTCGGLDLVMKISPRLHDERIIREFAVLREFASRTDLPVPAPLYLDGEGELLPGTTLVMTRLPGAVMHECYGLLNYGRRRTITDQIARDLAELHTIREHGFGGVELPAEERCASWPEFWLPRFDRVIEEAAESGSVPRALIDGAREVRPTLAGLIEIGPTATMTHYDVWSGNVMLDVESDPPRVTGYIDIPGFFADYARELSFAMLFGVADRRFFDTWLARHDLDDGFRVRASVYNLKMNIKHVQMYPGQRFYQQGAAECLAVIREAIG